MEPINTKHGEIAFEFASALVNGNYSTAYNLLSETQKKERSPDSLKEEYENMIEYGEGPVNHIEAMNELTEWPSKESNDVGWAYVALASDDFSEAVAVVVCNENNQLKIREIEWGRP